MIKTQTYTTKNITINSNVLKSFIDSFWSDVFSPLVLKEADKYLMIMCKVAYNQPAMDMAYRTLGHLRSVNHNDKDLFHDYLSARLGVLNESYTSQLVNKIIFTYIVKDGQAIDTRSLLQDLTSPQAFTHKFNNMVLPITMNPEEYGVIELDSYIQINGQLIHRFLVNNNQKVFRIDVNEKTFTNNVTILGASDLKWVDTKLSEGSFMREIGKSTLYFVDGQLVLRKQQLTLGNNHLQKQNR